MNTTLIQAITQKRRLRMVYKGQPRRVEPQCYGIGNPGRELLRVYLPDGGKVLEPLFLVAGIKRLELLDEVFTHPGPNYKRGDSAMKVIFAEL